MEYEINRHFKALSILLLLLIALHPCLLPAGAQAATGTADAARLADAADAPAAGTAIAARLAGTADASGASTTVAARLAGAARLTGAADAPAAGTADATHEEEAPRQWGAPFEKADLLLFSTHADDEHLFFAGILPYCAANDIKAAVVYMNNHNDNPIRNTEMLDGLWAVGIRNTPVIAEFPDLYSESLGEALKGYARKGYTEEDFIAFCVINIRRFKPSVVVGHAVNGEYGHGGHMLSADALMKAAELSGDGSFHEESIAEYGIWDPPKVYLNQWGERKTALAIDEPLPFFGGKTAFQVSQYGFSFHKSQHWTWFNRWLNGNSGAPITASTQIRSNPPGRFGLYRTLVGEDPESAEDLFANIVLTKDIPPETISPAPAEPPEPDILQPEEAYGQETAPDEPGQEGAGAMQGTCQAGQAGQAAPEEATAGHAAGQPTGGSEETGAAPSSGQPGKAASNTGGQAAIWAAIASHKGFLPALAAIAAAALLLIPFFSRKKGIAAGSKNEGRK